MPYHDTKKYGKNGDGPLQIITVNIPRSIIQYIDSEMVDYDFPSRSEVVRTALRQFIQDHALGKKRIVQAEVDNLSDLEQEMNDRVIRIA